MARFQIWSNLTLQEIESKFFVSAGIKTSWSRFLRHFRPSFVFFENVGSMVFYFISKNKKLVVMQRNLEGGAALAFAQPFWKKVVSLSNFENLLFPNPALLLFLESTSFQEIRKIICFVSILNPITSLSWRWGGSDGRSSRAKNGKKKFIRSLSALVCF